MKNTARKPSKSLQLLGLSDLSLLYRKGTFFHDAYDAGVDVKRASISWGTKILWSR